MTLKLQMNQVYLQNLNCVIGEECGNSEKCKDSELYFKGECVFSRAVQGIRFETYYYLLRENYLDLHTSHINRGNPSLALV